MKYVMCVFLAALALSVDSQASNVVTLGPEASGALSALSRCPAEFTELVQRGSRITQTQLISYEDSGDHEYRYVVRRQNGFTSSVVVGTIVVYAEHIEDAPADGSSTRYRCSIAR